MEITKELITENINENSLKCLVVTGYSIWQKLSFSLAKMAFLRVFYGVLSCIIL
jgi:hypothetical protein